MQNVTLVAYFDDPLLPYLVREILRKPENKRLLMHYERGIPSWAVFLPSYGLPYRSWMRKVMTITIFIVTVTSMILGFYDLYKHIPLLRETLYNLFGPLFEWFEKAFVLRFGLLFAFYISSFAEKIAPIFVFI